MGIELMKVNKRLVEKELTLSATEGAKNCQRKASDFCLWRQTRSAYDSAGGRDANCEEAVRRKGSARHNFVVRCKTRR